MYSDLDLNMSLNTVLAKPPLITSNWCINALSVIPFVTVSTALHHFLTSIRTAAVTINVDAQNSYTRTTC